jgi:flagellar biosynthesis protein FlhF
MAGGVHIFIGPTGSGKTTSIAKLAAQYVLHHGSHNLALVTTDVERIAAHEQLRVVGQILNVPVHVVDDIADLPRQLQALSHKSLVLVDTGGDQLAQQDSPLLNCLQQLPENHNRWMLLNATAQYRVLTSQVEMLARVGVHHAIVTKLDEAQSIGEVLAVMASHPVSVAYIANGPKIPDDLSVADGKQLINQALQLAGDKLDDFTLAQQYAACQESNNSEAGNTPMPAI